MAGIPCWSPLSLGVFKPTKCVLLPRSCHGLCLWPGLSLGIVPSLGEPVPGVFCVQHLALGRGRPSGLCQNTNSFSQLSTLARGTSCLPFIPCKEERCRTAWEFSVLFSSPRAADLSVPGVSPQERSYIPEDQRHTNKNSQVAYCYSETIPAPTGKEDAQQKSVSPDLFEESPLQDQSVSTWETWGVFTLLSLLCYLNPADSSGFLYKSHSQLQDENAAACTGHGAGWCPQPAGAESPSGHSRLSQREQDTTEHHTYSALTLSCLNFRTWSFSGSPWFSSSPG